MPPIPCNGRESHLCENTGNCGGFVCADVSAYGSPGVQALAQLGIEVNRLGRLAKMWRKQTPPPARVAERASFYVWRTGWPTWNMSPICQGLASFSRRCDRMYDPSDRTLGLMRYSPAVSSARIFAAEVAWRSAATRAMFRSIPAKTNWCKG